MRAKSLLSLCLLALLLLPASVGAKGDEKLPVYDGVGGEFSAPSSLGRPVALSDYRGKVVLLFFGYTSCQDVCPVTLSHLKALIGRLGPAADSVQVLFVTVDPAVDTADHLRQYLARFDERFVGFTGTPDEIKHISGLFMAEHERSHDVEITTQHHTSKTFTDRNYIYTHSQQIYLLDKSGRTRGLYYPGSPLEEMEGAVHALLHEVADPKQPATACDSAKGECPDHPAEHHHPQGSGGSQ